MAKSMDLFEDLRIKLMCEYQSDLISGAYVSQIKDVMKGMDLRKYPMGQLWDMAQYLYDRREPFADTEEAAIFFARSG